MTLIPSFAPLIPSFSAILGCSSLSLGFLNEAKYYLLDANDYQGLKTKCLEDLNTIEEGN